MLGKHNRPSCLCYNLIFIYYLSSLLTEYILTEISICTSRLLRFYFFFRYIFILFFRLL